MKYWTVFICIALLTLPHPARAAACVGLSFETAPSVTTFQGNGSGYAAYGSEEFLQTVSFRVRDNAVTVDCDYFVTLSAGQSGNFSQRHLSQGADILHYNAYLNTDKSDVFDTNSKVIEGHFSILNGLNQVNDHSFYWTIEPMQVAPASGLFYQDAALELTLNGGILAFPVFVSTTPLTFQARVENSIDLSLVDSGAPFDVNDTTQIIDFGNLESGEQKAFDIVVRSNAGYAVTMQSEHSQTLAHASAPAVTDKIDYTITLNGATIDLSSGAPVQVFSDTDVTPATGMAFPIDFTIGTLSGKETAGTYSDVISVDVTAN